MKYVAREAEIGGVRQHLWKGETLDPEVPMMASVSFEAERPIRPPLAMSLSVRVQPTDSLQVGSPETVFFKDLSLEMPP